MPENKNHLYPPAEATDANAPRAILEAARRGVAAALRRHKLLGNPVVTWRNGKVAWIPPEEIEI